MSRNVNLLSGPKVTPKCQKTDLEIIQFLQSTRNIQTNIYTYTVFPRISVGGLNKCRVNKNAIGIKELEHISRKLECNFIDFGNFGMYNVGANH